MGLLSSSHIKMRPDLPYLTLAESLHFKRLQEGEALSFFRTSSCKGCDKDIPKTGIKEYCSKQCYEEHHDSDDSGQVDG